MLVVAPSSSVVTAVKSAAVAVDRPLKSGEFYELAATVDMWIRQRREDQKGDAEVGKGGSMFVAKGRVVVLGGYNGSVLSVVRDGKVDGVAVLTIAER